MHGTVSTIRRTARRLAAGCTALAFGAGMAGCSAVDSWDKATADAWAVTYEVSVSGGAADTLHDVAYLQAPARGEDSSEVFEDSVATASEGSGEKAAWRTETTVTAQQDAAIAATPGEDATATCRILLDGTRELAEDSAGPGERVECSAATPAFGQ
ncbi:hypothetical protein [Glutamicibacter sp. TV12E]|uniref:hypothetical protein n=1 Tax=Glutamicibacter sp. TV12E TaxID=3446362 RepID=UPI0040342874